MRAPFCDWYAPSDLSYEENANYDDSTTSSRQEVAYMHQTNYLDDNIMAEVKLDLIWRQNIAFVTINQYLDLSFGTFRLGWNYGPSLACSDAVWCMQEQ